MTSFPAYRKEEASLADLHSRRSRCPIHPGRNPDLTEGRDRNLNGLEYFFDSTNFQTFQTKVI